MRESVNRPLGRLQSSDSIPKKKNKSWMKLVNILIVIPLAVTVIGGLMVEWLKPSEPKGGQSTSSTSIASTQVDRPKAPLKLSSGFHWVLDKPALQTTMDVHLTNESSIGDLYDVDLLVKLTETKSGYFEEQPLRVSLWRQKEVEKVGGFTYVRWSPLSGGSYVYDRIEIHGDAKTSDGTKVKVYYKTSTTSKELPTIRLNLDP